METGETAIRRLIGAQLKPASKLRFALTAACVLFVAPLQAQPPKKGAGKPDPADRAPAIAMTPAPFPGRLEFPGVDTHVHLHPANLARMMIGEVKGAIDHASGVQKAADRLVQRMDAIGIRTALVVTVPPGGKGGARNESTETELMRAVARHPGRLALMGGGAVLNPMIQSVPADAVDAGTLAAFQARAEKVLADAAPAGSAR